MSRVTDTLGGNAAITDKQLTHCEEVRTAADAEGKVGTVMS